MGRARSGGALRETLKRSAFGSPYGCVHELGVLQKVLRAPVKGFGVDMWPLQN